MQELGFSIQVGFIFYSSFSIPQISHSGGNGGKRAAFQVKLNGTESPPRNRQLVSILYTYKDGAVEKLFGGEVGSVQLMPEFFPYRVYQVTCRDFESIFLNVQPFSYRELTAQGIGSHALRLMILGGAIASPLEPWPRDRLNLVIRQSSDPPPWVDSTNAEVNLQPFSVENSFLGQAIQKLCAQFGFSYSVDFGTWLRTDILGNNALANLTLTRNDFGQINSERLLIDTSPDANTCLQQKWSNLKVQFQARDINRVLVAKDAESLLNRNVPQMNSINNYLIAANSPENSIPLLTKTGTIKSYFISTDAPGGGSNSGGSN